MDELTSAIPDPEEIRAQIDRMIASDEFSRSPQLGAFLRFVVESVLQGNSSRIKAYTIGVEVFRRDSRFDPQLDPIVRVEATRLRRTIDRYYASIGGDDTVRIDIPRGSYVPTFSRHTITFDAPARMPALQHLVDRLHAIRTLLVVIAVIAVALVAAVAVLHRSEPAPKLAAEESAAAAQPLSPAAALPSGNGMPVVFMPPFEVRGTPGPRSISARSLHDTLTDAFTHFDLVNILVERSDGQAGHSESASAREMHADYRFVGSVEYSDDGAARSLFRLIDAADGSIVWSRFRSRARQ